MLKLTILDSGMPHELVHRAGCATALWSTQALLDAPELVQKVFMTSSSPPCPKGCQSSPAWAALWRLSQRLCRQRSAFRQD